MIVIIIIVNTNQEYFDNELEKYMNDNNCISNFIEEGKRKGFLKRFGIGDKMRIILYKVSKNLYKKTMLARRKVVN